MSVPSNLIPTRITQLPDAPVASSDGLLLFVYQGVSYKVRAGDLLQVAGVPTTRQVIAGTGLIGGGALANNITLSVAPGGIGSTELAATGVTPGTYGSSSDIPQVVVDSTGRVVAINTLPITISGYVPVGRQVIAGTGLSGGGTLGNDVTLTVNFASTPGAALDGVGSPGVANVAARSDHQHPAIDLANASQVSGLLSVANGGTGRSLVPSAGAMVYSGADGLYVGPVGAAGQVLVSTGTGAYTWGSTLILAPQAANSFFAGPAAGPNANPSFRAITNTDLPNSGVTAGSYGSASAVPVLTLNSKGLVTAASTATVFVASIDDIGDVAITTPTNTDLLQWNAATSTWRNVAPSTVSVGNATTVTDGVYTTGSYADPAWITSLSGSKITGQLTSGISGGNF